MRRKGIFSSWPVGSWILQNSVRCNIVNQRKIFLVRCTHTDLYSLVDEGKASLYGMEGMLSKSGLKGSTVGLVRRDALMLASLVTRSSLSMVDDNRPTCRTKRALRQIPGKKPEVLLSIANTKSTVNAVTFMVVVSFGEKYTLFCVWPDQKRVQHLKAKTVRTSIPVTYFVQYCNSCLITPCVMILNFLHFHHTKKRSKTGILYDGPP